MGHSGRAAPKLIIRVLNAVWPDRYFMPIKIKTIIERSGVNAVILGIMDIEQNLGIW